MNFRQNNNNNNNSADTRRISQADEKKRTQEVSAPSFGSAGSNNNSAVSFPLFGTVTRNKKNMNELSTAFKNNFTIEEPEEEDEEMKLAVKLSIESAEKEKRMIQSNKGNNPTRGQRNNKNEKSDSIFHNVGFSNSSKSSVMFSPQMLALEKENMELKAKLQQAENDKKFTLVQAENEMRKKEVECLNKRVETQENLLNSILNFKNNRQQNKMISEKMSSSSNLRQASPTEKINIITIDNEEEVDQKSTRPKWKYDFNTMDVVTVGLLKDRTLAKKYLEFHIKENNHTVQFTKVVLPILKNYKISYPGIITVNFLEFLYNKGKYYGIYDLISLYVEEKEKIAKNNSTKENLIAVFNYKSITPESAAFWISQLNQIPNFSEREDVNLDEFYKRLTVFLPNNKTTVQEEEQEENQEEDQSFNLSNTNNNSTSSKKEEKETSLNFSNTNNNSNKNKEDPFPFNYFTNSTEKEKVTLFNPFGSALNNNNNNNTFDPNVKK